MWLNSREICKNSHHPRSKSARWQWCQTLCNTPLMEALSESHQTYTSNLSDQMSLDQPADTWCTKDIHICIFTWKWDIQHNAIQIEHFKIICFSPCLQKKKKKHRFSMWSQTLGPPFLIDKWRIYKWNLVKRPIRLQFYFALTDNRLSYMGGVLVAAMSSSFSRMSSLCLGYSSNLSAKPTAQYTRG